MLNKKLVIAALLAAAAAQEDQTPAPEGEVKDDNATPEGETPKDDTPKEGEETPEAPDGAGAKEEAGGEGEKGDDSDGLDFEKARKAWKETLTKDDGSTVERILCDVGEDAFWEEAQAKYKQLEIDLADAKGKLKAAEEALEPLQTAWEKADEARKSHQELNADHLEAYTEANDEVKRLEALAGGVDGTQDATDELKKKTDLTAAAEKAVADQRARIEKLIDAKRTQDQEEALWDARVTAATTAESAATTAKEAADAALLEAQEQVTTRSWLFEVLRDIDATEWAADCNTGNNPKCELSEDDGQWTKDTSVWTWPANCNYTSGSGNNEVTHKCTILGLSGNSAGLVQSAAAAKGTARTNNAAPTELFSAYEQADYTYVSAATPLNQQDSSPHAIALDTYLNWQKLELAATMMGVACWKDATGNNFADGDAYTWCHTNNAQAQGDEKFHPLLQKIDNADSLVAIAAEASTAKGTFGSADNQDTGITVEQQRARAKAQVNLWFADWVNTALDAAWATVGKESNRSNETSDGSTIWAQQRDIGIAEATQASKVALLGAATKEKDAVTRWKAAATTEAQAAGTDLEKAQELLADLVAEIAPIARGEIEARNDLADAITEQAARVAASAELGEKAKIDSSSGEDVEVPATGAQAVLAAALKTKESVEAQQAFHDARTKWAFDNRAPALAEEAEEKEKVAKLEALRDAALSKFDDAREACKSAAFQEAQDAREEAIRVQEAKTKQAEEVLKAYTALAKFPEDGTAGTLCHYAKVGADVAQTPRTECAEGEPGKPLCCGAAQRFLKDGTKLTIETCQLATDTTYTYYPALPDGALVAPTAETWRFQCISAAQKLAAAATAALAAGYMMA